MKDSAVFLAEMGTAAHNLREPLRMVRCYADILSEPSADQAECISRIQDGAERLEKLLTGMFEVLQLPRYYQPRRVDLDDILLNAMARLEPARRTGIRAATLPAVHGDFDMLTEVFSRLLDNALKFHGDKAVEIAIQAHVGADGQIEVSVQDHGIGIEESQRERCFEMFRRLHGREVPGEGFGLAYARRAVELHGGQIRLAGAPGEGTTVIFTLPAAD